MTTRALLLDLDRTLVDLQSFTDYTAALRDVRALTGEWAPADVPATDWDQPTMACMSVLHSLLGDPRWQDVSDAIAVHEDAAIRQSTAMPTLAESTILLRALPTAVVTLVAPSVVPGVLRQHGLGIGESGEITMVVGRSREVRPKPEADGLLLACSSLGVQPEGAVMIGDSTWDAEAASRAGVRFIGVPTAPGALPPDSATAPTLIEAITLALHSEG